MIHENSHKAWEEKWSPDLSWFPPTSVQNQQLTCFSNVESTAQRYSEGYGGAAPWWSVHLAHVWPLWFNPCAVELWDSIPALQNFGVQSLYCRTLGFNPTLQNSGVQPLHYRTFRTANSYLFTPDRRHWWLRTESIPPSPAWVTQKQLHLRKVYSSVCDDSKGLHSWCPLYSLQAAPLKKVSFSRVIAVCVMYVPVCLCVWMHVCICVSVSICACMCGSLCLCLCMCVWVCVNVYECMCVSLCVCTPEERPYVAVPL